METTGAFLLAMALLVVGAMVAVSWRTSVAFDRNSEQAVRTGFIRDRTNALLSSLKDAETGQRGFLLTGREEYLSPYRQALKDVPVDLDRLASAQAVDADQISRIEGLRSLVKAKLEELRQTVAARQDEGTAAAVAIVLNDRGKADMDQIRDICAQITATSDRQLRQATEDAQANARELGIISIAGGGVLFLILSFSGAVLWRETRHGQRLFEDLSKSEELLATFVRRVPAAVAMLDRDMRYVHVSDRWCTDYRLGEISILGRTHYEVFPDIPERWKEVHRRGLAGETVRSEDDLFERAAGGPTWLRWEVRPWGNRNGLPEGILIFTEDITEDRRLKESLRESEERMRLTVDSSGLGTWDWDIRAGKRIWSEVAKRHFGLPPDAEIDEGTARSAIVPADREVVQRRMAEAQRPEDGLFAAEYRTVGLQDGVERWISARGKVLFDRSGRPIRFLGTTQDLTERRRMEEALRQREREVATLLDNTPDVILRFDRQLRFTYVNAKAVRASGTPREDFIGRTFEELGRPQDLIDRWTPPLRRALEAGESATVGFSYPSPSGQTEWEHRVVPEFAPDGSVESVLVIGVDITERLRLEAMASKSTAEAREREGIIAALFDTTSQAILGVGTDGKIELGNRMAEQLFGYEPNELRGKCLEALIPPSVRQKHTGLRESFESTAKRRPMGLPGIELHGCRKDGTLFPVEVSLSHVETGRGPLAVAFVTDISEHKKNERELREHTEELRKMSVALITAEEDTARQIAQELHDDISQRLAFLSMEIAKHAAVPPAQEEFSRQLGSFRAKILDIADSIRTISHQMHPAILDELGLSAALESMCLDLPQTGMHVEFAARDVPEKIDKEVAFCLYRVCQESLRNVTKHAQAEYLSVVLSSDGDSLQLAVIDSGVGFETARGNLGLGTRTMKERVRLVGGTFSIESGPGHGTSVVVRVPLKGRT